MATQNPTGRAEREPATPGDADRQDQGVVLALLLEEHPVPITEPELDRAINAAPGGVPIEVPPAVRELVGAGLLHRHGQFVVPSRAALYVATLGLDL